MNLSAGNARRKWPCEGPGRWRGAMVTVAAVVLVLVGPVGSAAASRKSLRSGQDDLLGHEEGSKSRGGAMSAPVPLPRPRPAEAPGAKPESGTKPDTAPDDKAAPAEAARPAEPAPPEPSACRRALTEEVAIAPSIPDIHGPGGCGGEDLVRLEAVVLADKRRVAMTPAATLRCKMALAISDWVRTDVAPMAAGLGSPLSALDNYDSYECRGRNRIVGAQLSEHGRANALDVRGFKLADGRFIGLTDRTVPRELRETVLHSVCSRFVTVLGPGSDWYHEEHIHLDLMERRNSSYRICQWNVWEPLPRIAPLLPAERPEEAPPREVAAGPADAKSETKSDTRSGIKPAAHPEDKSGPAPDPNASDAAESDDRASEPAAKQETTKSKSGKRATKKRR
jgi:hypothetical protein